MIRSVQRGKKEFAMVNSVYYVDLLELYVSLRGLRLVPRANTGVVNAYILRESNRASYRSVYLGGFSVVSRLVESPSYRPRSLPQRHLPPV